MGYLKLIICFLFSRTTQRMFRRVIIFVYSALLILILEKYNQFWLPFVVDYLGIFTLHFKWWFFERYRLKCEFYILIGFTLEDAIDKVLSIWVTYLIHLVFIILWTSARLLDIIYLNAREIYFYIIEKENLTLTYLSSLKNKVISTILFVFFQKFFNLAKMLFLCILPTITLIVIIALPFCIIIS